MLTALCKGMPAPKPLLCVHCRLAISAAVKQLIQPGKDDEMAKSVLPAAQWVRAAQLLKAAVESVDDERPTGYTCKVITIDLSCLTGQYHIPYRAESAVAG